MADLSSGKHTEEKGSVGELELADVPHLAADHAPGDIDVPPEPSETKRRVAP